MVDKPAPSRLFDEKDVGAILKRAAEMQQSAVSTRFGLTLSELEQVAAEAGIDPKHIIAAAAELRTPTLDGPNFWGGPLSFAHEFVIDGDLDDVAWEEIVAETRRYFKDTGEVRSWSNSREWAHSGKNNVQAHVTATSRDGKTLMHLFWHEPTLAAATYVPLLVLGLASLPIVFEALALTGFVGAAVYFSVVFALFFIARFAMSQISRYKRRSLGDLQLRLEQIGHEYAIVDSSDADHLAEEPEASPRAAGLPETASSDDDPSEASEAAQRRRTRA